MDLSLKCAKESTNAEERLTLLNYVKGLPSVPEEQLTTIDVVSTLFNTRTPMLMRLEYMANAPNDTVIKLALQWDPDGEIGFNAMLLSENADLAGKRYIRFQRFAELVMASEVNIKVPNPLCSQAFSLLQAVWTLEASGTSPPPDMGWQQYTVASSLHARFVLWSMTIRSRRTLTQRLR